jgi:hypothetical protein
MTRQDLKDLSADNIKNSPPSNITAAGLRQLNNELIPSTATLLNDNTFQGGTIFNGETLCYADLYTGYVIGVSASNTVDLTAVSGNSVFISGYDTIISFGTAQGGEIRFLKFYDACQLAETASISVPTGQLINVEAGDSCTVIGKDDGSWIVVDYLRKSGLPLAAALPITWTVSAPAPTLLESEPNYGYGYRWISKEGSGQRRRKEWICDDPASSTAIWNPMAGSMGEWGGGFDLEIDSITGPASTITSDLRYQRISNMLIVTGSMTAVNVTGGTMVFQLSFNPNNQGLSIKDDTVQGWGKVWIDGQPAAESDYVNISYSGKWYVIGSSNIPNGSTVQIFQRATIFLNY